MVEQFCTQCGAKLDDSAQFCPGCGKAIEGRSAAERQQAEQKQFEKMMNESRMTWIVFLLAIYSIPAIITGLYLALDATSIGTAAWNDPSAHQWLFDHSVTLDQLISYIQYVGYIVIASGALVLISLICTAKRMYAKVAFITCLIGALLCCFSVFGIIMGILVAWMILSAKDLYNNEKKVKTE